MSDLDFDELDKAVNTLMGDVPKVDLQKADEVKTLSISSTLPDESRPSLAKLDSELSKVNSMPEPSLNNADTSPASSSPSLATRRGGRFMDVVHPSSDMKGVVKPAGMASRQGVTIEPTTSMPMQQPADKQVDTFSYATTAIAATPVTESEDLISNSATDGLNTQDASNNDWPDPLDMDSYAVEPDTSNVPETVAAPAPMVSLAIDEVEDDLDAQPLVSPFLPDAKVEKRPLGGAPAEEPKTEEMTPGEEPGRAPALGVVSSDDTAVEDAAEQLPANPAAIEQPLPPELQSDLMAIETDGGTTAHVADRQKQSGATNVEKPQEEKKDAPVTPVDDKKPLGATASASAATLSGPTSIPQQYHEAPTTSDQTNGAIYDTDSYHQPLAHPAKTNSGWLWIIWILLLLMVGGGGAVALYFTGII